MSNEKEREAYANPSLVANTIRLAERPDDPALHTDTEIHYDNVEGDISKETILTVG